MASHTTDRSNPQNELSTAFKGNIFFNVSSIIYGEWYRPIKTGSGHKARKTVLREELCPCAVIEELVRRQRSTCSLERTSSCELVTASSEAEAVTVCSTVRIKNVHASAQLPRNCGNLNPVCCAFLRFVFKRQAINDLHGSARQKFTFLWTSFLVCGLPNDTSPCSVSTAHFLWDYPLFTLDPSAPLVVVPQMVVVNRCPPPRPWWTPVCRKPSCSGRPRSVFSLKKTPFVNVPFVSCALTAEADPSSPKQVDFSWWFCRCQQLPPVGGRDQRQF